MMSSGERGRGWTAGNASAGLVSTVLKSAAFAQVVGPTARQVWIWNCRREVKRFWPAKSIALTWIESRAWGPVPARSIVTCLPEMGEPADSQLVASLSSIIAGSRAPSPVADAPPAEDARFLGSVTV